jgi:hypothetical protein
MNATNQHPKRSMFGFYGPALAAALIALLVSGCSSEQATPSAPEPQKVAAPEPGKATVIFMRPTLFGGAIQSSVFDITTEPPALIGIVGQHKKVAYVTSPGVKRFMVIGETAEFMDANLSGGKTYYVRVVPHMGLWKARFSLEPLTRSVADADLDKDLADCEWTESTPSSAQWAQNHMESIQEKKAKSLPEFLAQAEKPTLSPEDGR